MSELDLFTRKRLLKFVETGREKNGELPTLKDLEEGGFSRETIDAALKLKLIEMYYVTLTNGTIVKGFKVVTG